MRCRENSGVVSSTASHDPVVFLLPFISCVGSSRHRRWNFFQQREIGRAVHRQKPSSRLRLCGEPPQWNCPARLEEATGFLGHSLFHLKQQCINNGSLYCRICGTAWIYRLVFATLVGLKLCLMSLAILLAAFRTSYWIWILPQ